MTEIFLPEHYDLVARPLAIAFQTEDRLEILRLLRPIFPQLGLHETPLPHPILPVIRRSGWRKVVRSGDVSCALLYLFFSFAVLNFTEYKVPTIIMGTYFVPTATRAWLNYRLPLASRAGIRREEAGWWGVLSDTLHALCGEKNLPREVEGDIIKGGMTLTSQIGCKVEELEVMSEAKVRFTKREELDMARFRLDLEIAKIEGTSAANLRQKRREKEQEWRMEREKKEMEAAQDVEVTKDDDDDDKLKEGGEGEAESSEGDDIPLTFKEFSTAAKPMKVVISPAKATNPVEFKANSTQMSTGFGWSASKKATLPVDGIERDVTITVNITLIDSGEKSKTAAKAGASASPTKASTATAKGTKKKRKASEESDQEEDGSE